MYDAIVRQLKHYEGRYKMLVFNCREDYTAKGFSDYVVKKFHEETITTD